MRAKCIGAMLFLFSTVAAGQSDQQPQVLLRAPIEENTGLWTKYEQDLKANPKSSITHFRMGEIYFQHGNLQSAASQFRDALNGNMEPKWIEVWSHLNLGKVFDASGQRDRAINEYKQAQRTKDNTRGALDEAALYLELPYPQK
jgi:tetratricopeptide (TPR) repeat protein